MADLDSDRSRSLDDFAHASGQPRQPSGHSLVRPTSALSERVIGAQPVAVYRDEGRILQKLTELAARAGDDWLYRFPVRSRDGGADHIEGPTIKLANDIARVYGNCTIEVREVDVGDAWVFYARFNDIETGFSMERAYRQHKSFTSLKTKDADRQMNSAYQTGQSKAIRNVIVNSLQMFSDHAVEAARNSLVQKIGLALDEWRDRTIAGLQQMGIDVARAERKIGRPAKDWLAPHVAQVIAMGRAVRDGMATVDEQFPAIPEVAANTPAANARDGQDGSASNARPSTASEQPQEGGAMEPSGAKTADRTK